MVDFREYVKVNPSIDMDDPFFDEFSSESPFDPIDIGEYLLHLFASEESFCQPQENSFDPYYYTEWEVMIEKKHRHYDMVVVTHKIFNEIGYPSFEEDDIYAAYVPVDLVQEIFDYLTDKIRIPILPNKRNTKNKKDK